MVLRNIIAWNPSMGSSVKIEIMPIDKGRNAIIRLYQQSFYEKEMIRADNKKTLMFNWPKSGERRKSPCLNGQKTQRSRCRRLFQIK
jgi:hypothetical protein